MLNIVGSIDNAWKTGEKLELCHLLFLKSSFIEMDVSRLAEFSEPLKQFVNGINPDQIKSPSGKAYDLGISKDQGKKHIDELHQKGMETEKTLSDSLDGVNGVKKFTYSEVDKVTLVQGGDKGFSRINISLGDKGNMEYRLMHSCFEDHGKLDNIDFIKYKAVLKASLKDKLVVEK
jgi:hypothetical protein